MITIADDDSPAIPRDYLATSLAQSRSAMLDDCSRHIAGSVSKRPIEYTGFTALTLCGIELPYCPQLNGVRFHVLTTDRNQRPTRANTSYLQLPKTLSQHRTLTFRHRDTDIVCTHPLVTWAILARWLSMTETIVLLDAILRANARVAADRGGTRITMDDIRQFLARYGDFPGSDKCQQSIDFITVVTDSTMECRTLLALLRQGLPHPAIHHRIVLTTLGEAAVVDLAYPEQRTIIEYDGDAHRQDKRQFRRDERKRQAMRADGYEVIVAFADDILTPRGRDEFVRRVATALGIDPPGTPLPAYQALLDDDRRHLARKRQRRYRARARAQGRRV